MPAGEIAPAATTAAGDSELAMFTVPQRERLRASVAHAREVTGLDVVLYVGELPTGRAHARGLLAARADPDEAVVVAVDPQGRRVEIVTGQQAALTCDDRACGLAAAAMTSSFGVGDLAGGLRAGLDVIADQARKIPVLHLHEF